jgi:hypothetical protein
MRLKFSLVCLIVGALQSAQSFQQNTQQCSRLHRNAEGGVRKVPILAANEKEDFLPETSFGAEVVPEGQRPVNEYLDMSRAPLFGWASNDVGSKGVSSFEQSFFRNYLTNTITTHPFDGT